MPTNQGYHSCSVCQQIVIDLSTEFLQCHVLDVLKAGDEAGRCELIKQYLSQSKSPLPSNLQLTVGRYRNRQYPSFAHIGEVGQSEYIQDDNIALLSRIYATKGIQFGGLGYFITR